MTWQNLRTSHVHKNQQGSLQSSTKLVNISYTYCKTLEKNVVISGVIYDRLYKTEWPSDEPIGGKITCCLVKTKGSLKTKYLPDIKNLEENK